MTKVAQLHDGTQIHFPDHVQDHEMDAAVQRHTGANQAINPQMLMQLLHAMVSHAGTSTTENGLATQLQHKTHVVAAGATVDAINAAADKIAGAIGQLAEALNTVSGSVLNTMQQKTVAAPDGSAIMPVK